RGGKRRTPGDRRRVSPIGEELVRKRESLPNPSKRERDAGSARRPRRQGPVPQPVCGRSWRSGRLPLSGLRQALRRFFGPLLCSQPERRGGGDLRARKKLFLELSPGRHRPVIFSLTWAVLLPALLTTTPKFFFAGMVTSSVSFCTLSLPPSGFASFLSPSRAF